MKIFAALLFAAAMSAAETPDVIYFNGRIATMAPGKPRAEALAIKAGRFLAVGSDAEVKKLAGPQTRQVDLKGRGVLPGLMDSHTHPIGAGLAELDTQIPTMRSIPEVLAYVSRLAARIPAGQVIHVPKVYSTRMKERRYPTRWELDKAAPGRMVLLDTGYNAVLSSAALAKMGITRDTPPPKNGKMLRDASGEPTGVFFGARQLWSKLRPSEHITTKDRADVLARMLKAYNAVGITSTIDRGQGAEGFRIYQQLRREGKLSVRTSITYSISGADPSRIRQTMEAIPFVTGFGDEWLRVNAIKVVADGGILLGTAYLREGYGPNTDVYGWKDPDYRGELAVSREALIEMAKTANRLGWQMTAHTAGGGATDALLDAYEAADREQPIRGRRFTVTHGNFPNAEAIARAKKLGVVFDCQPAWHHFDGESIAPVFGPSRMKDFLPFRSLFDAGVVVAGGSDHMIRFDSREAINPYNPFFGMWMAVTRKTAGETVLGPEQRITREEALKMWTLNGAYLTFEENLKGSIEPGKLADFVVISKDFLSCPEDEIRDIEALLTVVDGKVVYERK
ncbi:MAG: amidohydrolase [Acidobacteria bacterium]|nr:amidohydrolase [Acidobacteriota bacterium]